MTPDPAFVLPERVVRRVPLYLEVGDGRVVATFASNGVPDVVEVRRERGRSYPGLLAPAPRTDIFYRMFNEHVRGRRVVDIGTGAGSGLSELSSAASLIGIDSSEVALAFAKSAQPGIEFLRCDVALEDPPEGDVLLLVDVLGEVVDPELVLDRCFKVLPEDGLLCVAESQASVAQALLPPARRAFSRHELIALAEGTGFRVSEFLLEGQYLALVFSRAPDEWSRGLTEARALSERGQTAEACARLQAVPETDGGLRMALWFAKLSDLHLAGGTPEAALSALLEGQRRVPDDAELLARLANVAGSLGQDADAVRFSSAALERDPTSASAVLAFARALSPSVDTKERMALWSNAARLCPDNLEVAALLAMDAALDGSYLLGTAAMERAREYHSRLPIDFHVTLGFLYQLSGRISEAQLEAKMAKMVAPGHPGVRELLEAVGSPV